MKPREPFRLPEDKERTLAKVRRLEYWTIFFLLTIAVVVFLTMGGSQAMKAAWIEDVLSLVPPVLILIALHRRKRAPDEKHPYGHRRVVVVAFMGASMALTILGTYILYDSALKLVRTEHPTIGMVELFGQPLWSGWLMIAALVYSAVPPVVLGRLKLPPAEELHDKALFADARMNRADWMTAVAAIVGVLGIGMGWWWADALAAGFIALDILRDGVRNLRRSIGDLMDRRPMTVRSNEPDDIDERICVALRRLDWVRDADVRLREEGHVFTGEAFVIPTQEEGLVDRLREAAERIQKLDWRVYDVIVTPVRELPHDPRRSRREAGPRV